MRNKTIAEVKSELNPLIILSNRRQYCLTGLHQIARDNNLDQKMERTKEEKAWLGQPKRLMQVMREQGWIDENNIDKYSMDIAKDNDGEDIEGAKNWSFKCLMASCLDFAEEMTALQPRTRGRHRKLYNFLQDLSHRVRAILQSVGSSDFEGSYDYERLGRWIWALLL
jgi:hypothetical protein